MNEGIHYIDDGDPLHTVQIYGTPQTGSWVIFIHGGAWRDPRQTFHDADPLFKYLLAKDWRFSSASLNYRLSPAVRHPAHQSDIIAGLKFLKQRYGMEDFILIGHSAGGCLAFQAAQHVPGCRAVIGIEGIYDLMDLVREYPGYRDFVESAFGMDHDVWTEASPIEIVGRYLNRSDLTVQLMQSTEDELLGPRQTERFFTVLQHTNVTLQEIAWIKGTHDSSIRSSECHTLIEALLSQLLAA